MIQLFSPLLGQEELDAVADSFNAGWIGKGEKVNEFEAAWARHISAKPAQIVSTSSCTEALVAAVNLLNIGPGDEVIIPTVHFIGAAQAVLAAGARPVFCDTSALSLNTTAEHIAEKITRHTKAIILNHYGGLPCDMGRITNLLSYHSRIKLIEDAANAPASRFGGRAIGTFGDIGVWSFDAMKIMTTGDGGIMYIRDIELADRARRLLYLGTDQASGQNNSAAQWWQFKVVETGARRSLMNDLAAGIGLEQLKKLPFFLSRREAIRRTYDDFLSEILPVAGGDYFYWLQTDRRDDLATYLRANGIYTSFRYYPLHWAYNTGDSLPGAERAARKTLLLPYHHKLSDEDVSKIVGRVLEFYGK